MSIHPYTRLLVLPAPPDADNDTTEGYELGDVVHVTGGGVYDCRDATEGAAVWEERTDGSYTDEEAQDAIGAMVDATLEYVDATPLLRRAALTGDVTAAAGSNATTVTNASVIAKVLTAFSAGAGTVSSSDSILTAFQKVVGNIALKLTANAAITGATKTKITYDANGLVTAGADLAAGDLPSGIDAAKLSAGNVSNTEFDFLDGVTSAIQTQINTKASTTYVDALLAANDAMVFKGVIDASGNPNYPAADAGHLYRISVAGKIGGGSGVNVEAGDLIICIADGTASGNQATVGTSWGVSQVNLDGAVIGPSSASDNYIVVFDMGTGKLIKLGSHTIAQLLLGAQIAAATSDNDFANDDQLTALRSGGGTVRIQWLDVLTQLANTFSVTNHNHDGDETIQLAQANTHQSPDTDTGTSSLHHTIGTGANQAAAGNHATHTPAGIGAIPNDGWIAGTGTWSYTSADSPAFVASVPDADAALMSVGWRWKLTQTSAKYFIVTAKGSPSGGFTPVTIYGGTDYTLANAAISSPFFSPVKAPFGFPLNPDKWTVTLTDTSDRTQSTPTTNTWYNLGSLSIVIPIGLWRVSYKAIGRVSRTASTSTNQATTLSTANNSESDVANTSFMTIGGASGTLLLTSTLNFVDMILSLAAKTTYYLNARTTLGATDIAHRGDVGTTIVKAECAYL